MLPRLKFPPRKIVAGRQQILVLYRLLGLGCLLVILVCSSFSPSPKPLPKRRPLPPRPRPPLLGTTVLLDPGHGGADSGYRRRDCREDALNYRFAVTLKQTLISAGARVLFTVRSSALDGPLKERRAEPPLMIPGDAVLAFNGRPVYGTVDCLHRRAATARAPFLSWDRRHRSTNKGLYFLAIHHDAFSLNRVHGGHVLYDRRDGGPPSLARILARRLSEANLARKRYNGELPESDARQLGVLNPRYNPIPQRVLLEVATISNPIDRKNALSPSWRWKVARLITEAIIEAEK